MEELLKDWQSAIENHRYIYDDYEQPEEKRMEAFGRMKTYEYCIRDLRALAKAEQDESKCNKQNVSKAKRLFCPNEHCQSEDVYFKGNKCMCGYCGEKWAI